ncbi:MAG: PHP-associated domain-containing protein [Armatimonadota bacterium]|nr:PHP domain-containing protein [bacterium]
MFVALHVHTNFSACSESPVEEIARYCREREIEAIGITDHNDIAGAQNMQHAAPDLTVITGEEISSRDGEIVGLFLKEKISAGMDLRETCLQIKRQGGLVYVPHPFDRFKVHRVRRPYLMGILDLVDIIEVFNAKISLPIYNAQAEKFAKEHGKVGAVGSDSHYVKSIGSAINVMEPFDSPVDFLDKLSRAEFKTGAASLAATWWVRLRKLARIR